MSNQRSGQWIQIIRPQQQLSEKGLSINEISPYTCRGDKTPTTPLTDCLLSTFGILSHILDSLFGPCLWGNYSAILNCEILIC